MRAALLTCPSGVTVVRNSLAQSRSSIVRLPPFSDDALAVFRHPDQITSGHPRFGSVAVEFQAAAVGPLGRCRTRPAPRNRPGERALSCLDSADGLTGAKPRPAGSPFRAPQPTARALD